MAAPVKNAAARRAIATARPATRKPAKAAATQLDLVRENPHAYGAGRAPEIVDLAPALVLTATGQGDPNGPDFREAVGALYAVAYTIKFTRRAAGPTFKVAPLEGLWWGRTFEGDFSSDPRDEWNWQMLIRVPDDVTLAELAPRRPSSR